MNPTFGHGQSVTSPNVECFKSRGTKADGHVFAPKLDYSIIKLFQKIPTEVSKEQIREKKPFF
jgi:hypothetical protein